MTVSEARLYGETNGRMAARNCEPAPGETRQEAAFHAEMNARQYAGHMPTEIHRDDHLFSAYEDGVASGIADELDADLALA
jgi:hypothetical protein